MSRRGGEAGAQEHKGAFYSTHWTDIFDARSGDEARRQAALERLLKRYWKPVYCYLRCKGFAEEDAKDLTQGFFHEVVLGRRLIQRADRAKGRFRTFLLTALDRYVANIHRDEKRKRRMPKGGLVSIEEIERLSVPEPVHYTTPSEVFDYAWASALLDQVLAELAVECREKGNAIYWEAFRAMVLQPIMDGTNPPSLGQFCAKHGIANKKRASNMVITVKRRFQAVLRRHVRQMVTSDAEVQEEIHYLMKVFSGHGAAS